MRLVEKSDAIAALTLNRRAAMNALSRELRGSLAAAYFADTHARVGILPGWGLVNRVVEPDLLLSTCRALARGMASCAPGTLRRYKQLIDPRLAMSLADALRHEATCARASAVGISSEAIGQRRSEVQQRGRSQRERGASSQQTKRGPGLH